LIAHWLVVGVVVVVVVGGGDCKVLRRANERVGASEV
jgi:hypothetical protein